MPITLTGGSAYGLAAADGVVECARTTRPRLPDRRSRRPRRSRSGDLRPRTRRQLRPTARTPRSANGQLAPALAGRRAPAWGSVGAGTGARAGGLQGGVGTASTTVRIGDCRHHGCGDRGRQRERLGHRPDDRAPVGAARTPAHPAVRRRAHRGARRVDGPGRPRAEHDHRRGGDLGRARQGRMLEGRIRGHDGLARAIRPAHSMTDGDTIFTLATGAVELPLTRGRPGSHRRDQPAPPRRRRRVLGGVHPRGHQCDDGRRRSPPGGTCVRIRSPHADDHVARRDAGLVAGSGSRAGGPSGSCRPWARSTTAIWHWSPTPPDDATTWWCRSS